MANCQGKVYFHRHVVSLREGRWIGKHEVVHHLDGDRLNNSADNLEALSQSEHASKHGLEKVRASAPLVECKGCGTFTRNKLFCSYDCDKKSRRKAVRPSKEHLEALLAVSSWTLLAREYGVSDNAIRKWAKSYGIDPGKYAKGLITVTRA